MDSNNSENGNIASPSSNQGRSGSKAFLEKYKSRKFIERQTFESYRETFSNHASLERTQDGVITVRLQNSEGGPIKYDLAAHNTWGHLWNAVGNDLDNEVLILTATGDTWLTDQDPSMFEVPFHTWDPSVFYDYMYHDATKLIENFINDINYSYHWCYQWPRCAHRNTSYVRYYNMHAGHSLYGSPFCYWRRSR